MDDWERQNKLKYRDHDVAFEDLTSRDLESVRSQAIRGYVNTPERDNVSLIVRAFMGLLTSKGYRIVKENK